MTMTLELMESIWIAQEQAAGFILTYYLVPYRRQSGTTVYALRVEKSSPEGVLLEHEATPPVMDDIAEALRMAGAFAAGTVPPSTLLEMADDYLSQV
jgi:hypothetical protein